MARPPDKALAGGLNGEQLPGQTYQLDPPCPKFIASMGYRLLFRPATICRLVVLPQRIMLRPSTCGTEQLVSGCG